MEIKVTAISKVNGTFQLKIKEGTRVFKALPSYDEIVKLRDRLNFLIETFNP